MPPRTPQLELPLRSPRRQKAAERRARRAVGKAPESLAAQLEAAGLAIARDRRTRVGALWAAALTMGLAGGLWFGRPAPLPQIAAVPAPAVEAERAGPAEGQPAAPAETLSALQAPVAEPAQGLAGGDSVARAATPERAALASAVPAEPAPGAAAAPLEAPTQAALVVPPGRPAWQRHAVPVALEPGRPLIAVVIDDLGLDRRATAATAALPGPLTLAFLAYAGDLPAQTRAARQAGHELLLHQPMQPQGPQDPGPDALRADVSAAENLARLERSLDRLPGVVGLNNHMGSRFTADAAAVVPVMAELRRRGLLFVDSRTTAETVAAQEAARAQVPHVSRDVFLDHDHTGGRAYVEERLAEVEAIARETGAALAIGHPHDGTLEALAAWLPSLRAKGFQLVPVSALVRARMTRQFAERGE